jgi:single-strand DNA-binding protein
MNKVCLIGRITKDVELRVTEKTGTNIVSMFIAINNGKDKEGNEIPADYPKICVYDKQAENVSKYCKKGSKVGIEGRIKTRSWDKEDGTKGYETYIVASKVEFLDSKPSESVPLPEPDYVVSSEESDDPYKSFGQEVALRDEDLPF